MFARLGLLTGIVVLPQSCIIGSIMVYSGCIVFSSTATAPHRRWDSPGSRSAVGQPCARGSCDLQLQLLQCTSVLAVEGCSDVVNQGGCDACDGVVLETPAIWTFTHMNMYTFTLTSSFCFLYCRPSSQSDTQHKCRQDLLPSRRP
jgi:hypothetical protein